MSEEQHGRAPNEGQHGSEKPAPSAETPSPGTGQPGVPAGQAGEVDLSKLSDEQIEALLTQQEKEELAALGLEKFTNWKQVAQAYKELEKEGATTHNEVKALADLYDMTPREFLAELKSRAGKRESKGEKKTSEGKVSDATAHVESVAGRVKLDRYFDRFQRQMSQQEETEIPDSMQEHLETYVPAAVDTQVRRWQKQGKSKDEVNALLQTFNPFPPAHRMYLFDLQEGGDVEDLKKRLGAVDEMTKRKLNQLKIKTGGKGKKTPEELESAKAFGFDD